MNFLFLFVLFSGLCNAEVNISALFTPNSSFLFYFSLDPVNISQAVVVNPYQESLLAAFLQVKYTPCLKLVRNFKIFTLDISQVENPDPDISQEKSADLSFKIPILYTIQLEIQNFLSQVFY
jgi:hypothetical protein